MIFHSPILALLLASLLSTITLGWAGWFGWKLVRGWNLDSGAESQLALEKRTYLVATLLKLAMVLELASLILFVINADQMASMFTGAMCAVGTLSINGFGIPALLVKMAVFMAATVWLLLNHADEMGRDYPLIRAKYTLLLGLAPLVAAGGILQFLYFYNLNADVITSCCSRTFVGEAEGVQAEMAGLPPGLALGLLAGSFALAAGGAGFWRRSDWLRALYGPVSAFFFVVAIVAIISVISSYVYEEPHHHCPFCILKPEYGFVGFALYLPLFFGTALGLAAGLMAMFKTPDSLQTEYPAFIARTMTRSAVLFGLFMLVTLFIIWRSHLILFG